MKKTRMIHRLTFILFITLIQVCVLFSMIPANAATTGTNWAVNDVRTIYQPSSGGAYYPRLIKLANGIWLCAFDTDEDGGGYTKIKVLKSTDGGLTWGSKVTVATEANVSCATPQLFQLTNGNIWCSYRTSYQSGTTWYTAIKVKVSTDSGTTWSNLSGGTVVDDEATPNRFGGVWEPHAGYVGNTVAIMYCNDGPSIGSNGSYQHLQMKTWNGSAWSSIITVSNPTNSRDGMPVWCRMADGRYIVLFESTDTSPAHFGIKYKISNDGLNWSGARQVLYTPLSGKRCNAPYVVLLSDGRLICSFQTDESNLTYSGDMAASVRTMLAVADDDSSIVWTDKYITSPVPFDRWAAMISLLVPDNRTIATAFCSNYPQSGLYLRIGQLNTPVNTNLINNWSFEPANCLGWDYASGWGSNILLHGLNNGNARCPGGGNYFVGLINDVYLGQTIKGLDDGIYTLKAYARRSSGQTYSYMEVRDYGGAARKVDIPVTTTWTEITIPNIYITNGQALVGFFVDGTNATQWTDIDNVQLIAIETRNASVVNNWGFETANCYAWDYAAGWGTNIILHGENDNNARCLDGGDHFVGLSNDVFLGQTLTGLTNGTYTLKAYVRRSGGQALSVMEVKNYGGNLIQANIPIGTTWTEITIPNINVSNGQALIGFNIDSTTSTQWTDVDNVRFYKQAPPPSNSKNSNNLAITGIGVVPVYTAAHAGSTAYLNDGVKTGQSLDSWTGATKPNGDAWGYTWLQSYNLNKVVYTTGNSFVDGGWYASALKVQVLQNSTWIDVTGLTVTPSYPYNNTAVPYKSYTFTFNDTWGDGVRIMGTPGGSQWFTSICELEVYFADISSNPTLLMIDNDGGAPGYTETGSWTSSSGTGYNGGTYRYTSAGTAKTAMWNFSIPTTGTWKVSVIYKAGTNRATSTKYTVNTAAGTQTVFINQTLNDLTWVELGTWSFNSGAATVTLNAAGSSGGTSPVVIADAVRLEKVDLPSAVIKDNDAGAPGYIETGAWSISSGAGYNGGSYRYTSVGAGKTAVWNLNLPSTGNWKISVLYKSGTNRATSAKYNVATAAGTQTVYVNQTINDLTWVTLGTWSFNAGGGMVTLDAGGSTPTGRVVIADVMKAELQ